MMRPIKLKISGFNSFVEEQIIEFDKLTERGLFGIFGPTGSGKSSILDAITMAMYGSIARDTKEFINTNVDSASISYEFEVGRDLERKRYNVERNIKKKPEGGYRTSLVRIREVKDDIQEIIAGTDGEVKKKIVELIGLTSDDFTRSVVLPQGKFNEFLKLKGLERRNMLERIFGLEKYGALLGKKIRTVKSEKQSDMTRLEGELNSYEGVSQEAYNEIEKELRKLQVEEKKLKEEKKKLDDEYEKLKTVWGNQIKLNKLLEKKNELDEKLEEIEEKKVQLNLGKRALNVSPFIDSVNETKGKIKENDEELKGVSEGLASIEEQVKVTELQYAEAFNKKNNRIPELIKKESELKQALELEEEINNLQNQTNDIQEEIDSNVKDISQYSEKSKEIDDNIGKINIMLKEIDVRIDEIKVTPEYRESIEEAAEVEREYRKQGLEKNQKEHNAKLLKEDIDKRKDEFKILTGERESLEKDVEETSKNMEMLLFRCPGDNNSLLKKQTDVNIIETNYKTANENNDKLVELVQEYDKILSSIKEKKSDEDKLNNIIGDNEKRLEELNSEIETLKMANMAGILAAEVQNGEACPVCGSIHHPKLADYVKTTEIEKREGEYKKLREANEELKREALDLHAVIHSLEGDENRYKKDISNLKKALEDVNIEELKKIKEKTQEEFEALKSNIDKWNNEKLELEDLSGKQKNTISERNTQCAAMGEGLKKDSESLEKLNEEIIDSEKKYNKLHEKYSELKRYHQIENFEEKIKEIKNNERKIQKLQDEGKQCAFDCDQLKGEKESIDGEIQKLKTRNLLIEDKKGLYLNDIEIKKNKVKVLSDDRNAEEYLKEICDEKEEIINNEKILSQKLEEEKSKKRELENNKAGILKNIETLKQILGEQDFKLVNSLKENKFDDIETVKMCLISSGDMKDMEVLIDDFTKEYNLVEGNIQNVIEELNGQSVDEEKWSEITTRLEELAVLLEQKNQDIGAKKKDLEDMKNKLEIVLKLTRQKDEIQHSLDLLDDLDKLVAGNKFVEFIAVNQLEYIAKEASKRLKEITRERYALELNPDGGFVMRDDFNGGTRRATDTLSGGETFLTSLSLALALSSQIQLKGNAPLEFFFLDEGFGTLDNELLEVVMSSLERLHNDKLCVGIISHVEELKNRVPVKLIVSPAQQGGEGSKVKVEYS